MAAASTVLVTATRVTYEGDRPAFLAALAMRFRMAATFPPISEGFRSCAAVFAPMAKQYTVVPLKPEAPRRNQGVRRGVQPTLRIGVCVRNSLVSLFHKEGLMVWQCPRIAGRLHRAIPSGCAEGRSPSAFLFFPQDWGIRGLKEGLRTASHRVPQQRLLCVLRAKGP